MGRSDPIWSKPTDYLRLFSPEAPVFFFSASVLRDTNTRYAAGFPGQVTFAVKANPSEEVLANLSAAGLTAFDVASSNEIALVRRIAPDADLHFNNPVRSPAEIAFAVGHDVASYSVDSDSELEKLFAQVSRDKEIAVRFKLPVNGAAYNFGAKFGAEPKDAAGLLRRVADAGYRPSLTFHPGTQCPDAAAWSKYIRAAGEIASDADVRFYRLNTGGGFPSHRMLDEAPALDAIFAAIETATAEAFGQERPTLLCEPGRGIAAECLTLAVRVKATRDPGTIFVNDGVYGALSESLVMGATDRVSVVAPGGQARTGTKRPFVVFGPTCDSIDRIPQEVILPKTIREGDYVLFSGMGAYSLALATRFNGFGDHQTISVRNLS